MGLSIGIGWDFSGMAWDFDRYLQGVRENKETAWSKLQPGDLVLFGRANQIIAHGFVTYACRSKFMSTALWDDDGFEFLYFLSGITISSPSEKKPQLDLTKEPLSLWNKEFIQGFVVKPVPNFQDYLDWLKADNSHHQSLVMAHAGLSKMASTDTDATVKVRKEQQLLRTLLFENNQSMNCAICGEHYPIDLLITAHIKKRAECNDSERLDMNVIMPACKLGCDDLFEKQYLIVNELGIIEQGKEIDPSYSNLSNYIQSQVGKKCSFHNSNSEVFFHWHRNQQG
ncbi:hypothetical protein ACFL3K_01275 [Pseudomonadota bacterium]